MPRFAPRDQCNFHNRIFTPINEKGKFILPDLHPAESRRFLFVGLYPMENGRPVAYCLELQGSTSLSLDSSAQQITITTVTL